MTVLKKSKVFALRMVSLYQYLIKEKREYVLSKQALKSGTSIGANVTEAEAAFSRRDFLAKMYIAFKECCETQYWLELLYGGGYLEQREFDSLAADCAELRRMLAAITKTTRESESKK